MNDFIRDDKWQRPMRDAYLVPFYQRTYSGFLLLDDGRFSRQQQETGIDTLVWRADRIPIAVEEKIVRAPDRRDPYDAICLETDSCTSPGFMRSGWMWYARCDVLLYCMHQRDDSLDCLWIDFPQLHDWFWPRVKDFPPTRMADTINRTECRVVPIADITAAVRLHRFRLSRQRTVIPWSSVVGTNDPIV
ncbi:hypothetical protein [Bradyrhizobium sp. 170]|uniref:hypothetical protein n=1 Tax=Bradyrhizobium sp. 170 TaxID=2782641 RepID=UPI001FFEEDA0|nr:hypothetical protein [Bradyrhizobium sp. 170]UPK03141.1 hypothetical protein IVB05_37295 [Bradyrhizobium sp. 170]